MKTLIFKNEADFKLLFNFNFKLSKIRFINGIAVNVTCGSLTYNELKITHNHVTISSYSVDTQDTISHFINPPYVVKF